MRIESNQHCWSFLVFGLVLLSGFALSRPLHSQGTPQASSEDQKTYEFIKGQWFDGTGFRRQTFYSVRGILTRSKPKSIDKTFDLANGFVIPPFADAHCHHFDNPATVLQQTEMYLRDGVFYAKVLTNSRAGALLVASHVNIAASVDVSYAHGGLTGIHSHPATVYEARALGLYTPEQQRLNAEKIRTSRMRENDAYYVIDTARDLENRWTSILDGHPDFIKVYLLDSEDYEKRKQQTGEGGGIDPKLLPQIVARAHSAGLRVSAHVDTAADYHAALLAGVDEMAHLPGYFISDSEDEQKFVISSEDARMTAQREVVVVPTASAYAGLMPAEKTQRIRAIQIRNLRLLKSAGVRFGIGPDIYGKTPLIEAMYLQQLGVFSNLELLKIWCEDTPKTIFPNRLIGRLEDGYEASFIVLKGNPIDDFTAVTGIALRIKDGNFL